MLYDVVLVSAVRESAVGYIRPLPLDPASHLPPHPTPLGSLSHTMNDIGNLNCHDRMNYIQMNPHANQTVKNTSFSIH